MKNIIINSLNASAARSISDACQWEVNCKCDTCMDTISGARAAAADMEAFASTLRYAGDDWEAKWEGWAAEQLTAPSFNAYWHQRKEETVFAVNTAILALYEARREERYKAAQMPEDDGDTDPHPWTGDLESLFGEL